MSGGFNTVFDKHTRDRTQDTARKALQHERLFREKAAKRQSKQKVFSTHETEWKMRKVEWLPGQSRLFRSRAPDLSAQLNRQIDASHTWQTLKDTQRHWKTRRTEAADGLECRESDFSFFLTAARAAYSVARSESATALASKALAVVRFVRSLLAPLTAHCLRASESESSFLAAVRRCSPLTSSFASADRSARDTLERQSRGNDATLVTRTWSAPLSVQTEIKWGDTLLDYVFCFSVI